MLGTQKRWQEDLFVAGSLSSLIPDDHILKQVDKVLDLSWLRKEVSDLYCQTNGRPGIDPEAAVRLMLAGFFQGIVHDRKLMREAQVNLAIRWFAGYAHGKNYQYLEEKNIDAIIPPQKENNNPKHLPIRLFKYDGKNKIIKCPGGKILTGRFENKQGWVYRSNAKDCQHCKLRKRCLSENVKSRSIMISNGYEALIRARRRSREPDKKFRRTYSRHRWKVEGMHGEAKTQHGLRRAVRRGLANVAIQSYLTAAVINLKRLALHAGGFYGKILDYLARILSLSKIVFDCEGILRNNGTSNWQLEKIEQV